MSRTLDVKASGGESRRFCVSPLNFNVFTPEILFLDAGHLSRIASLQIPAKNPNGAFFHAKKRHLGILIVFLFFFQAKQPSAHRRGPQECTIVFIMAMINRCSSDLSLLSTGNIISPISRNLGPSPKDPHCSDVCIWRPYGCRRGAGCPRWCIVWDRRCHTRAPAGPLIVPVEEEEEEAKV